MSNVLGASEIHEKQTDMGLALKELIDLKEMVMMYITNMDHV